MKTEIRKYYDELGSWINGADSKWRLAVNDRRLAGPSLRVWYRHIRAEIKRLIDTLDF